MEKMALRKISNVTFLKSGFAQNKQGCFLEKMGLLKISNVTFLKSRFAQNNQETGRTDIDKRER